MRRTLKAVTTLAVVLILLSAPIAGQTSKAKPEDVGLSTERLKRVHELIQRHLDAGSFSGAVTLVARNGRIAHLEAQGLMDIETKKPMATNALFRIMSMTKPVVGVAALSAILRSGTRFSRTVRSGGVGAYGTHFWVDPSKKIVGILMTQTSAQGINPDFENAVMQAVVE